ncbi:TPA: hypothetical protein ACVO4Y_002838 [Vibrio diabolicus]
MTVLYPTVHKIRKSQSNKATTDYHSVTSALGDKSTCKAYMNIGSPEKEEHLWLTEGTVMN